LNPFGGISANNERDKTMEEELTFRNSADEAGT
jgi:hypothetical protein